MTRDKARQDIIAAANKSRRRRVARTFIGIVPPVFAPKHLQRAVAVCRANGLVKPVVLVDAGFNEHGPRYRTASSA